MHTALKLDGFTTSTTETSTTESESEPEFKIIQKKVAARTKNLLSEVGQMKKQLATLTKDKGNKTPTSKKDRRGHPKKTTGASTLKKKSPGANAPDPQAVAAAKGTVRKQPRKKKKPDAKKKRQPKKK